MNEKPKRIINIENFRNSGINGNPIATNEELAYLARRLNEAEAILRTLGDEYGAMARVLAMDLDSVRNVLHRRMQFPGDKT